MTKLITESGKLQQLFDRAAEHGEVTEFFEALEEHCELPSASEQNMFDFLDEYALLQDKLRDSDEMLFGWIDQEEGDLFVFVAPSETALYNEVLRSWCRLTGRKLKKKKKSKKG